MVSIFELTLVVLAVVSTIYANPASGKISNEDWPEECNGKNYCWTKTETYKRLAPTFEKLLSGENLYLMAGKEIGDRDGDGEENYIGLCKCNETTQPITMIRDENSTTWYVPQTANYTVLVQTKECAYPNLHITPHHNTSLDIAELKNYSRYVHCVEQKIMFKFLVLSQDGARIEPEALSPYGGLPVYCSAKIFKKKIS